jgi:AP2-associated kinase
MKNLYITQNKRGVTQRITVFPKIRVQTHVAGRRNVRNISHVPKDSNGFELTFSQEETGMERLKASKPAATCLFQDEAFNTFVTEFDSNKLSSRVSRDKGGKEEALEAEIEKLKEQLK